MTSPARGGNNDEGLVPLFTLSPDQSLRRGRDTGAAHEDARAVFHRDRTFGYDCRLDGEFQGEYTDTEPNFKPRDERKRKLTMLAVTALFLAAAGGLVATQPGARAMVGSVFGGGAPAAAPAQSPPSQVLALGSGGSGDTPGSGTVDNSAATTPGLSLNSDATPAAGPSSGALPANAPGDVPADVPSQVQPAAVPPAASTVPSAVPPPAGSTPPIYVNGTYAAPKTATCDHGTAKPDGSCNWMITVQPGHNLDATLTWSGGASLQMTMTDKAGNVLQTQTSASGILSLELKAPPSPVYVAVLVIQGPSAQYTLGLADHPF